MKITRKDKDSLNTTVLISLNKDDFADKVLKVLKDYQKKANIPGFRKGHVPIGLVKKQYENSVTADEVNKILQEKLTQFIKDEKLEVLGNPLPKLKKELDWKSKEISFEFEIGLAPQFHLNLKSKKQVSSYKIEADSNMINEQVLYLQKQYGKLESKIEIKKDEQIIVEFNNTDAGINQSATFELNQIKNKKTISVLKSCKVGSKIELPTKDLFKSESDYLRLIGKSYEEIKGLNLTLETSVKEINLLILSELNQELFDKAYQPGQIKSINELKSRIKNDMEKQFESQSEQKLLNDISEYLISINKFDLPKEFLIKWLQNSGEKPLTEDQAREEYIRAEKGIRHQLIEGKIIQSNNLEVKFEDLKSFAKDLIKSQMTQYGQLNPQEKELDKIAARIFTNKEETKKISDQLMSKNILEFYKKNMSFKIKKMNFDSFVKEAYSSAQ